MSRPHTHRCPTCGELEACSEDCAVYHSDGVTSFPMWCAGCQAARNDGRARARRVLARRGRIEDGPELFADLPDSPA